MSSLFLHSPWEHGKLAEWSLARRSMALLRRGALGIAVAQLARMAVHAWRLAEAFQRSPYHRARRGITASGPAPFAAENPPFLPPDAHP